MELSSNNNKAKKKNIYIYIYIFFLTKRKKGKRKEERGKSLFCTKKNTRFAWRGRRASFEERKRERE